MATGLRTSKSVVHALFICSICDKCWEDYLTAQTKARQHATATGHKVSGELGIAVTYSKERK